MSSIIVSKLRQNKHQGKVKLSRNLEKGARAKSATTTTASLITSVHKPRAENQTNSTNHTEIEYMQLHGSTVVMATNNSGATSLTATLIIMSIFLFMTLTVTVAIIVFCRKKNTVFVLQKCEQEDEVSYELDDMNKTDIEFADFEGEHEAMIAKPHRSLTCPDLECLDMDQQVGARLLQSNDSETDDSGRDRSPVNRKLKRRSKSFTLASDRHGYQQMIVTAVMETNRIENLKNNPAKKVFDQNPNLSEDEMRYSGFEDETVITRNQEMNCDTGRQKSMATISSSFKKAKLEFRDVIFTQDSKISGPSLPQHASNTDLCDETSAFHSFPSTQNSNFRNEVIRFHDTEADDIINQSEQFNFSLDSSNHDSNQSSDCITDTKHLSKEGLTIAAKHNYEMYTVKKFHPITALTNDIDSYKVSCNTADQSKNMLHKSSITDQTEIFDTTGLLE